MKCLDYCNGLLSGLPAGQIARLGGVLRSAARLVLSLPSRAPVSAAMHDTLHCLDFPQRITYKLALRCTSVYMVRHQNIWRERVLLSTLSGQPHLHSSKNNKLFVPRSLTASMGPRAFCSSGPTSWNTLPARLWHSSLTLEQFKCLLKASLFAWLSQHAP